MTCTMHNVVELKPDAEGRYTQRCLPYRCSRCQGCFCCQHKLIEYDYWICIDGFKKPTVFDIGIYF